MALREGCKFEVEERVMGGERVFGEVAKEVWRGGELKCGEVKCGEGEVGSYEGSTDCAKSTNCVNCATSQQQI